MVRLSFEETLRNTNLMLLMMGIPPCEEPYPPGVLPSLKRNAGFIASFLLLAYTTIGELIYLKQMFERDVTFLEVTFQAPCIGYCTIGVLKMVILARGRNTIAELVGLFRAKWTSAIVTGEHWAVCEDTMRPAIRVTSVTALANVVMGIAFTILPIAEMIYTHHYTGRWNRQLAFNIWWPFDVLGGVKYYWFVYPLYVVIGFTGIIIHMAFDCLFCILAAHLCMQFRILAHNFGHVVEVANGAGEGDSGSTSRLQDAIRIHQELIGCSVFMQNVFGNALFINFLGSSIIICIQAFMITVTCSVVVTHLESSGVCFIKEAPTTKAPPKCCTFRPFHFLQYPVSFPTPQTVSGYMLVKFVLFMLCFLIELLMLCAYGEDIVESSLAVIDAAYGCEWYREGSVAFHRSVLQIIHRSQQPVILTAWKIWPIQMSTFSQILQASWSYFTLLKTVYGNK
ncbi:odorant receptor 4 [Anopheles gambiae]|uniref:odorant receptor 4 n=1 Tax=Anopheles gambiae TaxID=7165 RepID=UPI002AC9CFFD|nr:odorant receptor 4 [Anopheles gambiae]